jgi:hypothetical protein
MDEQPASGSEAAARRQSTDDFTVNLLREAGRHLQGDTLAALSDRFPLAPVNGRMRESFRQAAEGVRQNVAACDETKVSAGL